MSSATIELSRDQRNYILQLLLRGASPAAACAQLTLPLIAYARTLREDPDFRARIREVTAALSQNVAAALYRAAMQGNVTAQTTWLRLRPPPEWQEMDTEPDSPANFDDVYGQLTDHELLQLARAMGIDVPPEYLSPPVEQGV